MSLVQLPSSESSRMNPWELQGPIIQQLESELREVRQAVQCLPTDCPPEYALSLLPTIQHLQRALQQAQDNALLEPLKQFKAFPPGPLVEEAFKYYFVELVNSPAVGRPAWIPMMNQLMQRIPARPTEPDRCGRIGWDSANSISNSHLYLANILQSSTGSLIPERVVKYLNCILGQTLDHGWSRLPRAFKEHPNSQLEHAMGVVRVYRGQLPNSYSPLIDKVMETHLTCELQNAREDQQKHPSAWAWPDIIWKRNDLLQQVKAEILITPLRTQIEALPRGRLPDEVFQHLLVQLIKSPLFDSAIWLPVMQQLESHLPMRLEPRELHGWPTPTQAENMAYITFMTKKHEYIAGLLSSAPSLKPQDVEKYLNRLATSHDSLPEPHLCAILRYYKYALPDPYKRLAENAITILQKHRVQLANAAD